MILKENIKMKYLKTHLISFLFLTLFLSHCSNSPALKSELKIIGGSTPAAINPGVKSTVALVSSSNHGRSFCTGTLIAPQLVITAAHCIEDQSISDMAIKFENYHDSSQDVVIEMSEAIPFGSVDFFPNFDVAYIKLKESAPSTHEPIEILKNPNRLKEGMSITLNGYGVQKTSCAQDSCRGQHLTTQTTFNRFIKTPRIYDLLILGPNKGKGACFGDSGGPAYAFIDEKWYLVGVTQGFFKPLTPLPFTVENDQMCEQGNPIYTFAGSYVNWIEEKEEIELESSDDNRGYIQASLDEMISKDHQFDSFKEWCEYDNFNDPVWITTQKVIKRLVKMSSFLEVAEEDLEKFLTDCEFVQSKSHSVERYIEWSPGKLDGGKEIDLRPLATLKGLKEVLLLHSPVRSLSPLSALSNLEILVVQSDETSVDVSVIKDLVALKELVLEGVELKDISFLKNLTALKELDLEKNQIQDISVLKNMKNLEYLDLRGNLIEDFSVLKELPNLKDLYLTNNSKGDFVCPFENDEEHECFIEERSIKDQLVLDSFLNYCLYANELSYDELYSWSPFDMLQDLLRQVNEDWGFHDCEKAAAKVAELDNLGVRKLDGELDLELLKFAPKLEYLEIFGGFSNKIDLKNLSVLSHLKELETLRISFTTLKKISDIPPLPNLSWLALTDNLIEDVTGLERFGKLISLDISNFYARHSYTENVHKLTDISPIFKILDMERLTLFNHQISDVQGIEKLVNLYHLDLSANLITDLSPFQSLPNLSNLELLENPIRNGRCPIKSCDIESHLEEDFGYLPPSLQLFGFNKEFRYKEYSY